jgi:peptidoglycan/xylan/chitin deacetylase (PgdA/CDA1 family)
MVDLKKWIKKAVVQGRFLSLVQSFKGPRTVILRYHSVLDDPGVYATSLGKGIIHSTAAFTEQMEWIVRHYEPVSLDDVAASVLGHRPMPRHAVAITFDDGYADNFRVALPVLNRLGLKAAFYITVDCIEPQRIPWFCRLRRAFAITDCQTWKDRAAGFVWGLTDPGERRRAFQSASGSCARLTGPAQEETLARIEQDLGVEPFAPAERVMMNWEQVRELHRQGHVVGSHTLTHPNLAQVREDEAAWELRESKRRLDEVLGSPVVHFSYPSPILQPHWTHETVALCHEYGYQTAATCTPGAVRTGDAPLCLKRVSAPERMDDFKWAVECAFFGHDVSARSRAAA